MTETHKTEKEWEAERKARQEKLLNGSKEELAKAYVRDNDKMARVHRKSTSRKRALRSANETILRLNARIRNLEEIARVNQKTV